MAGNGAIAGLVGDHRPVGLRRVLGGADHRLRRRPDRRLRGAGDREAPRRPGRRPLGARPGRDLGDPRGRHLRLAAADRRRRRSRRSGTGSSATASARLRPARRAGARRSASPSSSSSSSRYATFAMIKSTIGLRVVRRGGGSRPRHQLARDVRVPGAVHPAAGVLDRPAWHGGSALRGARGSSGPDDSHRDAIGGSSA